LGNPPPRFAATPNFVAGPVAKVFDGPLSRFSSLMESSCAVGVALLLMLIA
jgi:hypothetical protein